MFLFYLCWKIDIFVIVYQGAGIRYGTDTMLKKYQGGGPLFILVPVSTLVLTVKEKGRSPERNS